MKTTARILLHDVLLGGRARRLSGDSLYLHQYGVSRVEKHLEYKEPQRHIESSEMK